MSNFLSNIPNLSSQYHPEFANLVHEAVVKFKARARIGIKRAHDSIQRGRAREREIEKEREKERACNREWSSCVLTSHKCYGERGSEGVSVLPLQFSLSLSPFPLPGCCLRLHIDWSLHYTYNNFHLSHRATVVLAGRRSVRCRRRWNRRHANQRRRPDTTLTTTTFATQVRIRVR